MSKTAKQRFAEWQDRGTYITVRGRRFFFVDTKVGRETIVILHGYPSTSYDYHKVLPLLSDHFRVIVHDHLGFGFSEKPRQYSYSLIEQADYALQLWQQLGIREAHLVAHDYGTSIATEIISRWEFGHRPIHWHSIVLGNGSMLIQMAQLLLAQRLLRNRWTGPLLARISTRAYFRYNMRKIWGDPKRCDLRDLDVLWLLLTHANGRRVLPQITRYITDRYTFWHRWIEQGLYQTDLPIRLYWGDRDPIAVVDMAHELDRRIRNSTLVTMPGIGHYPMLEAAEQWAGMIQAWIVDAATANDTT